MLVGAAGNGRQGDGRHSNGLGTVQHSTSSHVMPGETPVRLRSRSSVIGRRAYGDQRCGFGRDLVMGTVGMWRHWFA
ncbi:hypothetical protein MRB53_039266 [Persea americana]|nr:hypothetical protein MRB53_039266 [Persea americana]